jgi:hypothetical protein
MGEPLLLYLQFILEFHGCCCSRTIYSETESSFLEVTVRDQELKFSGT